MSGEVKLTATLSKDNVPVTGQPQLIYTLLEVMPTEVMADIQMPLNFSLVLDTSGSMSGEKIRRLKDAVKFVIDLLGPDDYVSIVQFSSSTTILTASQQARSGSDKQALRRRVDGLDASGGTYMAPAMRGGLSEVKKQWSPNRINRMVLLTDGQTENEPECKKMAEEAARNTIPIIALGIGTDWNENLLQEIGAESGGQADYIAKPQEIGQYFQSTVQAMQAAVVQNAVLTLRLVMGVAPRKVWRVVPLIADLGYSPISDRAITVALGELEKDQGQALLVELMLPARQTGNYRIAQAEAAYDVPMLRLVQEKVRADITLGFTPDPYLAQQVNPRVMNIVEKVTAFKLQTRALQEAELGNVAGATQKLRAAATILLSQGDTDLARTAQLEADKLEQQGQMTAEGKKTIQFKGSKTVKLSQS
jgi:Ca-activated chloride channel family protein